YLLSVCPYCDLLVTVLVVMSGRTPRPPLFPYTTLFRSRRRRSSSASASSPAPTRSSRRAWASTRCGRRSSSSTRSRVPGSTRGRSEEHTSELQSRENLVCRLLLEKKKKYTRTSVAIVSP